MEKEVHDLKMSLDARLVELRNRGAEIQTAGNTLKDYEQQIRALHVRIRRGFPLGGALCETDDKSMLEEKARCLQSITAETAKICAK